MRISDWSSDVCSSDLDLRRRGISADDHRDAPSGIVDVDIACRQFAMPAAIHVDPGDRAGPPLARVEAQQPVAQRRRRQILHLRVIGAAHPEAAGLDAFRAILRSAERRVGKECVRTCTSRWSPVHYKKKTE